MNISEKKAAGFTIIELLVVITIIGVLASVVLLAMSVARKKARDAKRSADVRQIMVALENYYHDNNQYPALISNLTPVYMAPVPNAPTPADGSCTAAQNAYTYTQVNSGADYTLTFCLGLQTGSLPAGVHTASSSGVN